MTAPPDLIEIPKRALFRPAEVCELVKVQPYVLRSWETEFRDLGVAKTAGGPRMYRRADVEQVIRIKHLLLVDGLTLAGARRKLEEESTPVVEDASLHELIGQNARDRLMAVKRGLRAILDLLADRPVMDEFQLQAPGRTVAQTVKPRAARGRPESARDKRGPARPPSATRRKRPA